MERKESCKCDTLSLKRINVSSHKRTVISECHVPKNGKSDLSSSQFQML